MKKKLCFIIRGISFSEKYNRGNRIGKPVDYKEYLNNYFKTLIEPLEHLFDIDFFYITYNHKYIDNLYSDFLPKKCIILNNELLLNKQQSCEENSKTIANYIQLILEKIKEYENEKNFDYDNYLITRFDLYLKFKLDPLEINFNKFNFLNYGHEYDDTNDNLYIFPKKFLKEFEFCLNEMKNANIISHYILKILKKSIRIENVDFIIGNGFFGKEHEECLLKKNKFNTYNSIYNKYYEYYRNI